MIFFPPHIVTPYSKNLHMFILVTRCVVWCLFFLLICFVDLSYRVLHLTTDIWDVGKSFEPGCSPGGAHFQPTTMGSWATRCNDLIQFVLSASHFWRIIFEVFSHRVRREELFLWRFVEVPDWRRRSADCRLVLIALFFAESMKLQLCRTCSRSGRATFSYAINNPESKHAAEINLR